MAEIFISYARSTEAQATALAVALGALGYTVWRDDQLPGHRDYADVIEEQLRAARAVVVVWSRDAVKSQWVKAEADVAREAHKLVQVSVDGSTPPLPFNRIQCTVLPKWSGDLSAPGWRTLAAAVAELTGQEAPAPLPPASLPPVPLPLPDRPSIAVLPFANLNADTEQEYFVDAMSEEVISGLSRRRWFFVIARNSSFAYKGRRIDVRQAGAELGVRYIVSGSVRRAGDRVRISVELSDTADGGHVWSERFDRDVADVFALQDEITEQVVRAIEPALVVSENARLARKAPKDLSALECFQRGMWHLNKVSRDHYDPAVASFRDCIARDPDLAVGHIGLARILYGGATIYGWSPTPDDDLAQAYDEARIAIRLDASDSDGYFALAGTALYLGRHAEALAAALRSVALDPNSAYAQYRLAHVLVYAGSPADAIGPIRRTLRLSPFDPQLGALFGLLSLAYYQSRDYAAAELQARAAVDHDFAAGHALLAASLVRLDRVAEARRVLPPDVLARALRATVRLATYANDADRDHLVEGLRLATAEVPA